MQKLTKKYTLLLFKSALVSSLIYGFAVFQSLDKLVKNEVAQFHLVTKSIQDYKSTLYILSVLFEAQIAANKDEEVGYPLFDKGRVYLLNPGEPLTHNERVVSMTAQRMFNSMPELALGQEYLLYYRSYEGMKILASHAFGLTNTNVNEVFSKKICLESFKCSKYASQEDLDNRIVVSDIYRDNVTNKTVITISSPVYDEFGMVGDVNADVYLDKFPFLYNKQYFSTRSEIGREIIIEDTRYPFHQSAHAERTQVDDRLSIVYKIPYSKIVVDSLWIYFSMVALFFYVVIRLDELKVKREKLKLAELAIKLDELTGLYNRAILRDSGIKYAIEKKGLAVIVIDGDKLKLINDNYGHHVGDEAIVYIAQCMRQCFRESDYLIRSGGDEFLVLLPGCGLQTAERLASTLSRTIRSKTFGANNLTLDISFGVTVLQEKESLSSAIKRADALLYQVKRNKA
ncbi:sensor domain-containing diguanylate cyclase [Vibrio mediterranei]|uniref:sensor domain-containing diguanylate cyclase n=1 Tax=Vibrio mediterranei TaxID=689 RepID=UPI001EFD68BD|nr:diguanylate cyclase [Vibrio mediterranei]MCG9657826.1 diguanylate cyclase [Vibrio mediterranei]